MIVFESDVIQELFHEPEINRVSREPRVVQIGMVPFLTGKFQGNFIQYENDKMIVIVSGLRRHYKHAVLCIR